MSFPKYPSYKESGVKWLGGVPAHWGVMPLRKLGALQTGITPPTDEAENYADEGPLQWVRPEDLIQGGAPTFASKFLTKRGWEQVRPVAAGSSLICCIGTIGKVGYVDTEVSTNQQITAATFRHNGRYFHFALVAARNVLEAECTGNVLRILNTERLGRIYFPVPPESEANGIAEFLDQETAKIDELVVEQRRLVELLMEKRQAVISHAITRGLNPKAPLRPSGVSWLGEIPAHWCVKRIKHLIAVLTDYTANGSFASLAENVTYLPEGFSRLVRLTDLREELENEGLYVDEHAHKFLSKSELFGGEILIANVGAYAGYARLMPIGSGTATLGPNMYLIRCKPQVVSNEFALLCLMSLGVQEQLKLASTSTAQPKLNKDDVRECITAIPPTLAEQQEILDYLVAETGKFDALAAKAKQAITLLQDRRTALIFAAITGQIDVRQINSKEAA